MSTETSFIPPVEIEVCSVSKWFGANQVLKQVSTTVRRGEAVVVIGPSGSGKTTLLRCINALEEYQEGEISLAGNAIGYTIEANGTRRRQPEREIAAMRAQVGMVFQNFNLFPHMSVLRNVSLGPIRIRHKDREAAEDIGRQLLDRVGLGQKVDALPGQLSGGQEPKAMLFDEVTSALDPELVGEVLDVMRQLVQDGMTMMIVTHEMAFARAFADRVVFMADGEVVEQGSPEEIFEAPKAARLQAFLKRFQQGYRL